MCEAGIQATAVATENVNNSLHSPLRNVSTGKASSGLLKETRGGILLETLGQGLSKKWAHLTAARLPGTSCTDAVYPDAINEFIRACYML